jgi:hypothetical protein
VVTDTHTHPAPDPPRPTPLCQGCSSFDGFMYEHGPFNFGCGGGLWGPGKAIGLTVANAALSTRAGASSYAEQQGASTLASGW